MSNLLFICSRNQWRSPTAELLFKDHPKHQARSAGTSDKARVRVNEKMIAWADVIFVMEKKHREILKLKFPSAMFGKHLVVFDIEDNYKFGDHDLIGIFQMWLIDYL